MKSLQKRIIIGLLMLLFFTNVLFAQEERNCIDCVLNFYKNVVFRMDSAKICNYMDLSIFQNREELTFGYSEREIESIVSKAKSYDEGYMLDSMVQVDFPNGRTLYFEVSYEGLLSVNIIWLSDGSNLNARSELLKRPAIINDKDGFVNIRKEPNGNSTILDEIYEKELFYYTPEYGKNWYRIYWKEGLAPCGYIHKSKITEFKDFPEDLKERVRKIRGGC